MSSKHSRKLVSIIMNESKTKSFGKFLSDHNTKLIEGSGSYDYNISEILCRTYHNNIDETRSRPIFSTAAILAVFDEFSTYGLMSTCKTSRGGVSVHLSTEIVKESFAGQDVVLKTSTDKVGKALGFCTMELLGKDGTLLARGKHIKYMPMGSLWDFVASPLILPITLALYEFLTTTNFGKYLLSFFVKKTGKHEKSKETVTELSGVGSVFSQLGLESTVADRSSLVGDADDTHAFSFRGGRHLHNLMDKLHGGAVAAAIEEACMKSRRGSEGSGVADEHMVQAMEVRYLAPMKGDLTIICTDDEFSPRVAGSCRSNRTFGTVINKKTGTVSVEYSVQWRLAPTGSSQT